MACVLLYGSIISAMQKKELLEKFLRNECTPAEAELALKYLSEDPALIHDILPKTEWDREHPDLYIKDEVAKTMHRNIRMATRPTRTKKAALAAAACFFALLVGFYWYAGDKRDDNQQLVQTPGSQVVEIVNNNNVVQEILLADHSIVKLYPNSVIKFEKDLVHNRNIFLKGKAIFKVAKNTNKPFIVYSGAISTTALGTMFLVKDDLHDHANVQLFEGKVVIKATTDLLKMDDIYLQPGQECVIDIQKNSLDVHMMQGNSSKIVKTTAAKLTSHSEASPETEVLSLNFNKTEVAEVLLRIEKKFHSKIVYNEGDVVGKYFTGDLEAYDSLQKVIKVVCDMNDLDFNLHNEVVEVRKASPSETGKANSTRLLPAIKIDEDAKSRLLRFTDPKAAPHRQEKENFPESNGITTFRKKRLQDVLNMLAARRKKKIDFRSSDIDDIYISGTLNMNDSLAHILERICNMNALTVKYFNNEFVIQRN